MTSSHDHRIAVLAEQAASGLSIVQFCRRRGIARSTFQSWRSRLHDRRCRSDRNRDRGRVGGRGAGSESRTAAAFVEAIVPASASASASASVSASAPSVPIVELRCGRRVAVPRGFDADDLARLLRLVESLDREAQP